MVITYIGSASLYSMQITSLLYCFLTDVRSHVKFENGVPVEDRKPVCVINYLLGLLTHLCVSEILSSPGQVMASRIGLYSLSLHTDVLPQNLEKSRNREIHIYIFSIALKIWLAPPQQRCRDACKISERYNHNNTQSCGFETPRDLTSAYRPLDIGTFLIYGTYLW